MNLSKVNGMQKNNQHIKVVLVCDIFFLFKFEGGMRIKGEIKI